MPKPTDESALESIRLRPGMYVPGLDAHGVEQLSRELISNALDEFLAGRATRLRLSWDGEWTRVSDDGAGLAIDPQDDGSPGSHLGYLTSYHRTPSADQHAPHVHCVTLGHVGLCLVTALSSVCVVQAWRSGVLWEWRSEKGLAVGPPRRIRAGDGRGTTISFIPDPEIFTEAARPEVLRSQLLHAAHLFPGVRIEFGEDEAFLAPDGLAGLARLIKCRAHSKLIRVRGKRLGVELDCVLVPAEQDDEDDSPPRPRILSWANGVRTDEGGSHVEGVLDAVRATLTPMPSEILIHVVTLEPRFAGPSRGKLDMDHVRDAVEELVTEELTYTDPLFGPLLAPKHRVWTTTLEHRGVVVPVRLHIEGAIDRWKLRRLTGDLDLEEIHSLTRDDASERFADGRLAEPAGGAQAFLEGMSCRGLNFYADRVHEAVVEFHLPAAASAPGPILRVELSRYEQWQVFTIDWDAGSGRG